MNITQVTVSYGQTQSLPEYSNVKVQVSLTAELGSGDDEAAVEAALWGLARQTVHDQIDQALEGEDMPAKYDAAPRYKVVRTYGSQAIHRPASSRAIVLILPNNDEPPEEPRFVPIGGRANRNLRLAHARRVAAHAAAELGAELFDCSVKSWQTEDGLKASDAATDIPF